MRDGPLPAEHEVRDDLIVLHRPRALQMEVAQKRRGAPRQRAPRTQRLIGAAGGRCGPSPSGAGSSPSPAPPSRTPRSPRPRPWRCTPPAAPPSPPAPPAAPPASPPAPPAAPALPMGAPAPLSWRSAGPRPCPASAPGGPAGGHADGLGRQRTAGGRGWRVAGGPAEPSARASRAGARWTACAMGSAPWRACGRSLARSARLEPRREVLELRPGGAPLLEALEPRRAGALLLERAAVRLKRAVADELWVDPPRVLVEHDADEDHAERPHVRLGAVVAAGRRGGRSGRRARLRRRARR